MITYITKELQQALLSCAGNIVTARRLRKLSPSAADRMAVKESVRLYASLRATMDPEVARGFFNTIASDVEKLIKPPQSVTQVTCRVVPDEEGK